MRRLIFSLVCLVLLTACGGRSGSGRPADNLALSTDSTIETALQELPAAISPTAQQLEAMGYVNVATLDPTLAVHIVYATADNFVGEVLYADLTEAYLLPEAAEKLVKAHNLLKESHPGYRFIVYDAARPMSVQRALWEVAVRNGKQYYVSNPTKGGGLHNYGAAVDLSILDENGVPLDMGTGYDFFGSEANTDRENALVAEGKLTEEQLQNRLLLREVMREAGFRTITSEWWHFNHCSLPEAIERYELIDF